MIGVVGVTGTAGIDLPAGPQPPHCPARTAVLAGRAVPEPAKPLFLGPVPLRHRQYRLGRVPAGQRLRAHPGAGERGEAPAHPRRPGLRHRRLLPRLAGLDHPELPRERGPHPRPDQPDLQGRRGPALRLGARPTASAATPAPTPSARPKVNFNLGASIRRPAFLSPNNTIAVSLFTERRSEFKVYLRQETGTTVTLRRETPQAPDPAVLAYTLSYGRTEATPESFCASFNACTPDVVALLRQNRVLATLTANGDPAAGEQSARSVARVAGVDRAHLELALPGLELVPAVRPHRGRLFVVPADRARRGVQLAGAGRRHLRAVGRRGHPDRQLHSTRAAVLCRRSERRPRLRPQRAGAGRVRGGAGRGGHGGAPDARHRPESRAPWRPPAATRSRSATWRCECRRRYSARGSGSRRSWTPAASGSGERRTRRR